MSALPFQLELARPEWLLALLVIPLLVFGFLKSLVDLPQMQLLTSLVVRCVIVALLVLSLAGLNLLNRGDDVFVVFAVDQSLSVDDEAAHAAARDFIETATEGKSGNRFAVLPFAVEPGEFAKSLSVRRNSDPVDAASRRNTPTGLESHRTGSATASESRRTGTNLASAVEIAAAAVPPNYTPHVVLMTDGNETSGDVLTTVASAAMRVSTVPLPVRTDPELQLTAVNVPAQVAEGEPFSIEVVVGANHNDIARIELFSGAFRIASDVRSIQAGENRFTFTDQITQPTEYTATIRSPGTADIDGFKDSLLDNNTASGLVFTGGKPKVLLIESEPGLDQNLVWALEEEGIAVEARPPKGLPESLAELQNFDAVIFSNIPATNLTIPQMTVIRSYVSEIGGGLVMLGGDQSFGLGGYYKTVIEEVLPVRSDFEKEKEKPGLAMVLVIDKSGSMGGQKIELAKDAARGAVDLLGVKDQIGVIAFDGAPVWVSELRPVTQKGVVTDRIAAIEPGGGTTMYPALEAAFSALNATTAKLKHVIVLTDGYSTPGDFQTIAQDMVDARITVSTVGIGDTDQVLLQQIAELGSGRYYFTDDPSSIPQIFAKETLTAGKSAINEDPFLPQVMRSTSMLSGIDFDAAPFLLGYVVTRPKPTSEVILATESGDPLLSWWRYGTGISVAFTSDASSLWAAEWLTWDGFNRFWAQVIRHAMRTSESKGFAVDVVRRGDQATITIDATEPDGQFLNSVETELTLIDPDLSTESISVPQTAPGRYETEINLRKPGAWNLQITQRRAGEVLHRQTRGIVVGYSDELRLRPVNEDLLKSVAATNGGSFGIDPKEVFEPLPGESAWAVIPLWPWLLSAALVLFVADVALRRLDMSRVFGSEMHRSELRT